MLRPCARIIVLLFGFVPFALGSAWVLGFWVLMQVWNVLSASGGDTAWWAHVGGLVAGAGLTLVFRPPGMRLVTRRLTGFWVGHRVPAARDGVCIP